MKASGEESQQEATRVPVHWIVDEGHDLPPNYIPGFDYVTWLPDRRTYVERPVDLGHADHRPS